MSPESITESRRKIGELDCVVLDTPGCDKEVHTVVVICHGFGAPGEDLVPCGMEIFRVANESLDHVRFVFPAAPIELDVGGFYDSRAWWPIDMIKLQLMMESGEVRDLRKERPELLAERNRQVQDLLAELIKETGVDYSQVVLGGFSQGAMLATDVTLSLSKAIGGLIVWSGTLLNEEQWVEYASNQSGLQVLQSHGRQDPILPFAGAELLEEMFREHGVDVEFVPFNGPHTIPGEAIQSAARMIAAVNSVSEGSE